MSRLAERGRVDHHPGMLPLLLLLAAPEDAPNAAIASYRALTQAEVRCAEGAAADEITVCARRDADRYRVPLTMIPVRDNVPVERARLLEPKLAGCGRVGQSFADCGFIGVTMSSGGAGTKITGRKLAP